MPNIVLAKSMLHALKSDFYEALNGGARSLTGNLSSIDIQSYSQKFKVKPEDIEAYCQTLTPMVPVHPVCVMCGKEWSGLEKEIKPISNGHILDWYDTIDLWCSGDGHRKHGTLWYYQRKKNKCSFDFEIENFQGKNYQIRWNCRCAVSECYGKTVLIHLIDNDTDYADYRIIQEFEYLPYDLSMEELYKLIQEVENCNKP